MYDKGQGVSKDYNEALKWYHLSADKGLAEAQFGIGMMYFEGKGVSQDSKIAITWFRMAAEQGHVLARKYLEQFGEKLPITPSGKYPKKNMSAYQS
jgi:TPR repeat protein